VHNIFLFTYFHDQTFKGYKIFHMIKNSLEIRGVCSAKILNKIPPSHMKVYRKEEKTTMEKAFSEYSPLLKNCCEFVNSRFVS